MVDPGHPLTARVAVNRLWQTFFGTGLVKTSEDFGSQGEPPSHPELLDWLATEYLRTGWDTKRMIRLLVTSGTYRQSSAVTQKQLEADPYNRLLGRASRFRLPAHVIRDQALAVSGLMVETIGGVSVKPYQPPGLWADFSFGKIKYSADSGAKLYRRSLYTFWRRSLGPPNMFDEGTRDVCHVNPQRTNTPLHALTLLNDETFAEAARVFGERLLGTPGNDAARMRRAFTLVLSRPPTDPERTLLHSSLDRARRHYRAHPDQVKAYTTVGRHAPAIGLDPVKGCCLGCGGVVAVEFRRGGYSRVTSCRFSPIPKNFTMQPLADHHLLQTRRRFFGRSSVGIGTAALAALLDRESAAEQLVSHFAPTAKRVIYLFQNGAPTQVDLYDHKPQMERFRGTDLPKEIQGGQRLTTMTQGKSQKGVAHGLAIPGPWRVRHPDQFFAAPHRIDRR
ncbi:MAG: hypothetical protein CM1200mP2_01860 [Planctomycetaceae bacterium]|nr:MAG: hypothetical protein CM1200mP2_01860 [Planctomycetaceae bacterium]